ncbi:MAG TPA: DUF4397 domain-containing protein [Sphingobacterium sp.]|nr:DUF4397 domain-containing protein [Sphingobacterium sp.]
MKKLSAKKLIVYLFGIITIGTLGSCMKDNDQDYPEAILTTVNSYLSANGVLYGVDNSALQPNYSPIPYQRYDSYRFLEGSRRLRIFTDNNQPLVDEIYTFKENTYYTSFIYGWQEDVRHILSEDKLLADITNQSGIRFLHLSPSEGKVNVYLNNKQTPLYEDRGYEGEEDDSDQEENEHLIFTAQNSGKHTIIITDEDDELLIEREYTFESGVHYSIILIGDSSSMIRPLYVGIVSQYQNRRQ